MGIKEQVIIGSLSVRTGGGARNESNHLIDNGADIHKEACLVHGYLTNWRLVIPTPLRTVLCPVTPKAVWDRCI